MKQTAIFWPMLGHVLLVYIVYVILRIRRVQAVREGAKVEAFRIRGAEPATSAAASGNLLNQYELPMLFHICCLAFFATAGVSAGPVILAWLFIALRYLHTYFHLTTNRVKHRSASFIAGVAVLGVMWIWFAVHLAAMP